MKAIKEIRARRAAAAARAALPCERVIECGKREINNRRFDAFFDGVFVSFMHDDFFVDGPDLLIWSGASKKRKAQIINEHLNMSF